MCNNFHVGFSSTRRWRYSVYSMYSDSSMRLKGVYYLEYPSLCAFLWLGPPTPFPVRNALSICALVMNCDIDLWCPAMPREYWMIYTGPAAVVWFDSSPHINPSHVSKLEQQHTRKRTKKVNLLMGEGKGEEGDRRGGESYNCKKAWSSINHSTLSGYAYMVYYRTVLEF